MEHAVGEEKSVSSGGEPDPKRYKGDPDALNPSGKSVVVLLGTDVTKGEGGQVFMPNTIEMAQLKKKEKGQYVGKTNGINFTSEMTEQDVLEQLHLNFPILKDERIESLSCASAVENRSRLEFHGEPRLWSGTLIKKHIRGNSTLYLLAEGNFVRGSEESQVSNVPSGPSQQRQPSLVQRRQGKLLNTARPAAYNMCSGTQIVSPSASLQPLVQYMVVGNRTSQLGSFPQQSLLPSGKQENQADAGHGKSITGQQPLFQVAQQQMSSVTPTENSSLEGSSAALQQSVEHFPVTTPARFQADLTDASVLLKSSSNQNLSTSVPQGAVLVPTSTGLQWLLIRNRDTLHASVSDANEVMQPVLLQTGQQGSSFQEGFPTTVATYKDYSVQARNKMGQLSVNQRKRSSSGKELYPLGHPENSAHELVLAMTDPETSDSAYESAVEDYNNVAHDGNKSKAATQDSSLQVSDVASQKMLKQVPMTTCTATCTEEKVSNVLPAGSTSGCEVQLLTDIGLSCSRLQTTSNSTASLTAISHGETSDSVVQAMQEENMAISHGETSDSEVQSMQENDTEAGQLRGREPVIYPCKGSTKGGDQFLLHLKDFVPLEFTSFVADFEDRGVVPLKYEDPLSLVGYTPSSLQGPGTVKVKLRSSDGSWNGGETKFLYEELFSEDEFFAQLVRDPEKQRKMFGWMSKGMNSPSNQQTSNSSDKTDQGSSDVNQSRSARSVKLLQLLVYKAAQIDGHEFIEMVFSTSAGKVVFNNYKNIATLPEDVARANGHTILADFLQDVNNRLSKESDGDDRTESIDWLELKHAVDRQQSLPCNNDAQMLRTWGSTSCPESDDSDSNYFADDETSPWSSPSHNNDLSELENAKAHTKDKSAIEHDDLFPDEVDLQSSDDDMNESLSKFKITVCGHACFKTEDNDSIDTDSSVSDLEDWNSEVTSTVVETSTGTTSLNNETLANMSSHQKTDEVAVIKSSEEELKKTDNDKTTWSREASPVDTFDLKTRQRKLVEHYQKTAKVATTVSSSTCQFDQIYTRLSWTKGDQTPPRSSQKELSHYTELFTDKAENRVMPKRILVLGKPGVGKTFLAKKLLSDWSNLKEAKMDEKQKDALRKFELVVSINLKQVSKCQTLREVISHSRLDEESSIDDLLCHIRKNQDKVLFVFDGYDAYHTSKKAELQYGRRSNSPIYNIFQGNNLRDCTVLVTTRPSHADELQGFADTQTKIIRCDISNDQAHAPCQESSGDDIDYKAKSGYVLVINNNIFPRRADVERTGSNDDVKNLLSLFDYFNFTTRLHNNQTQSDMLTLLTETAEKDFSRYDCFVCVILSHGSKDGIYGTDDDVIKVEAITKLFRRDECPTLEGKPKIFLIQACRGSQQDRLPIESDSDPIPFSSSSLPADADFLICFASAPGHQSYRQPLFGSWFISSIFEVFKEYAEREHLMDMMLRVNNRVAGFFSKEGLKQMPCQVCMLTRKVFFNPKYSRT